MSRKSVFPTAESPPTTATTPGRDRLSSLRYLKSGGGVAYFDYTRDAAARITKIRREGSLGIYYQYDALDRLTDETWLRGGTQIYAFSYDYDLSHNRMRMRREHAAGVEWDSSYYVYDVSDALTKRQVLPANVTTYYHYDLNGALVKQFDSSTTYFQYGANQLVTQVAPTGVSPWNFGYDAGLNRYTIDKGGTVSYYLWDGLNLLEERDSSGNLIARYSYGYSSIYGIGSCVEIYQQASEHKYTLVMDHRGTAYVLLDETGTEIGRRWYDAFGVLLGSAGSWPVDLGYQTNWLSFNIGGKWWGLSLARVYDFAIGRFTQRDPIRAPGSNAYVYAGNAPINFIDPTGAVIITDCPIDDYLLYQKLVDAVAPQLVNGKYEYSDYNCYDETWLDSEILAAMIISDRNFSIKGGEAKTSAAHLEELANLDKHLLARTLIIEEARNAGTPGSLIQRPIGCLGATCIAIVMGTGRAGARPPQPRAPGESRAMAFQRQIEEVSILYTGVSRNDFVPGDMGYIWNQNAPLNTVYAGENIIDLGLSASNFWGWSPASGTHIQSLKAWEKEMTGADDTGWLNGDQKRMRDADPNFRGAEGLLRDTRYGLKAGLDEDK